MPGLTALPACLRVLVLMLSSLFERDLASVFLGSVSRYPRTAFLTETIAFQQCGRATRTERLRPRTSILRLVERI